MDNSDFLRAVYGAIQDNYGWTTSFASDPNKSEPTVWGGNAWTGSPGQKNLIDKRVNDNNFFCVSIMAADKRRRSKDTFVRLCVLLADDAQPDELFGNPSYTIETSPGNYQVGVLIDRDDPDARDQGLIDLVLQRMAAANLIGADASGNNIVRYGRLPTGCNTKQRDTGVFATTVLQADLTATYSLADAVATFGLDLEEIRSGTRAAPSEVSTLDKTALTAVDLYKSLITTNLDERSYHDPLLKLSSGMIAAGMAPGAVVNNLRSLMLATRPETGADLARWEARFGQDLSRMVASAQKYAPAPQDIVQGEVFLSQSQLREKNKNVRWLVKGLVPEDSMGMIFGASGTYKSFIAIDLAMHMAHEMSWSNIKTKSGSVAYIAAEGGSGISRRLDAWCNQFGLVENENLQICTTPYLLTAQEEMAHIKDAISKLPETPKLVVIDTLSQTFNGDENSSSDIGDYLRMINTEIRAAFNCTVIVVHHTGHSAAERPRGSSAITANLDFILGVFRPDPERPIARLSVHKMKDGDKVDDLYFEMTRSVLGHDEDGDEISSLVARHTAAPNVSEGSGRFSKYDALCVKALASGGLVSEDDIKKLADKSDSESSVTKGIKRALDGMFKRGLVKKIGYGVWQRIA
jgi:hypothetical protein